MPEQRIRSIENRWDILYRDYPEVYEAFSNNPYFPPVIEEMARVIDFRKKRVADVGAGTGASTFALSGYAQQVIGVEAEQAMLRLAREKFASEKDRQVLFVAGNALSLPLANASVDLVTGVTLALYPPEQYRHFIHEGLRAAKEGVVFVGIPPGWYGGELNQVIAHATPDLDETDRIFLEEFQFAYQDVFSTQQYGSVEHMVNTYGFIFGQKVIGYLRQKQVTSVRWKFRIYSRLVA